MEHFNFDKLLIFREVIKAGSFSGAAQRLGVRHSTISKKISALEKELGVLLLHRDSRKFQLTEAGKLILEDCSQLELTKERITNNLNRLKDRVIGTLKINSLVHVGRHWVQPAVNRFLAKYPEVRVVLSLDDRQINFFKEGFDLGIRVGLLPEPSLLSHKIADNPVNLAASKKFIDKHGFPKAVEDLGHFPVVAYATDWLEITSWTYLVGGKPQRIQVHPRLLVNEGNALLQAVKDGLGIGYLSRFAVVKEFKTGGLVQVLSQVRFPDYTPIYALYPALGFMPFKTKSFLDVLQQTPFS